MSEDALVELARAHAIDLEYHDIWGSLHRSSRDALRALLAALGIDASSDAAAAERLQETLDARWQEILPPAIVVREHAVPWRVRVHLARVHLTQPLHDFFECRAAVRLF